MNLLRDNFIANMYGPQFLEFYAVVIAMVLIAVRWRVWKSDHTNEQHVEDPPEPVDTMDVAVLRGDVDEGLRLTVVELVQRGYLLVREKQRFGLSAGEEILHASTAPDRRHLTPFQRTVFDFYATPGTVARLVSDSGVKDRFDVLCFETQERLNRYQLVTPPEVRRTSIQMIVCGALVVLALGSYKLLVALAKGKTNVGFLVIMAVAGTLAVILLGQAPRVSRRGKAFIEKLRLRYSRLQFGITNVSHAVDDSALIFSVALFGANALEGTAYSTLIPAFRQRGSSAGGCGGGSCGGASCGGGSCGGGGCGGGGCGGCGGD